MAHFIDLNGVEFGIVDEASVTLWVDRNGIGLGGEPDLGPPPTTAVFPLMLMMRLRIHAAWLLFMLIPGF